MSIAILARPPVLGVPPIPDLAELFKLGVNLGQFRPSEIVLFGPVRSAVVVFHDGGESVEQVFVGNRVSVRPGEMATKTSGSAFSANILPDRRQYLPVLNDPDPRRPQPITRAEPNIVRRRKPDLDGPMHGFLLLLQPVPDLHQRFPGLFIGDSPFGRVLRELLGRTPAMISTQDSRV